MSWLCSLALVEECSVECYSDGEPSARWNVISTQLESSSPDKTTARSRHSPSGTTSKHSTVGHGEGAWTLCLEAFHVNHSALLLEAALLRLTDGPTCSESSEKYSLGTSSPKTSSAPQSTKPLAICERSATRPPSIVSARASSGLRIAAPAGGWLPTPTAKANHDAPSMRKWPAYARWQDLTGGRTVPTDWEWMMGWPAGWTAYAALETAKFREWQQQHSPRSPQSLSEAA